MGNNRLKNLIIVIICIILVVLMSMVLYNYFDSNNSDSIKKIDATKDIYYFVYGNEYSLFRGEDTEEFNGNLIGSMEISYPVINIDNSAIKTINNEIRSRVLKEETIITQNSSTGCLFINKENKFYRHEAIKMYSYEVIIYENIISIVEKESEQKGCNGSTMKYQSYIFDMNGQKLSNSEILNLYHFDENKLLNKLKEYMEKEYNLATLVLGLQEGSIDIYINDEETIIINYDGNDFTSKMVIDDFNKEMEE